MIEYDIVYFSVPLSIDIQDSFFLISLIAGKAAVNIFVLSPGVHMGLFFSDVPRSRSWDNVRV